MSNWPKHPNGTNKTFGEMTAEERASVVASSNKRISAGEVSARTVAAVRKVLNEEVAA